jgi:hypothetical protein
VGIAGKSDIRCMRCKVASQVSPVDAPSDEDQVLLSSG